MGVRNPFVFPMATIIMCVSLLLLIWFGVVAPQVKPIWTDQGKITSISPPSGAILQTWSFQVSTDHHSVVSPVISDCGWEVVGNALYVSELANGKYAQTDSAGNIICNN